MHSIIEWETLEYDYVEKKPDWFWAVGIITVSIAISAVLLNNVLFAVFIIISAFALVLQTVKKPENIVVRIGENGIEIGKTLYVFGSLDAFWIEETEKSNTLILKSTKMIMPYIVVPIKGVDLREIRFFLLNYINEEEMHEPLAQKLMEYLGF